jgi:hypothetical protein
MPIGEVLDCPKREELQTAASAALSHMTELISGQLKALHDQDMQKLLTLDKELEQAFGAKERAFGALNEHTKDHGC